MQTEKNTKIKELAQLGIIVLMKNFNILEKYFEYCKKMHGDYKIDGFLNLVSKLHQKRRKFELKQIDMKLVVDFGLEEILKCDMKCLNGISTSTDILPEIINENPNAKNAEIKKMVFEKYNIQVSNSDIHYVKNYFMKGIKK